MEHLGNEHRMFISVLLLAQQFYEDNAFTAHSFSRVAGIPVREIVALKMDIFKLLGGGLLISDEKYTRWLRVLNDSYAVDALYGPVNRMMSPISPPLWRDHCVSGISAYPRQKNVYINTYL